MRIRTFLACGLLASSTILGQTQTTQVEMANLREDLRGLVQRVGELTLRVEVLERQNAELREKAAGSNQAFATLVQLNDTIVELRREIEAGNGATAERAATQIRKLADATNAAIDSLAKGMATRPAVATTFGDNYPKEGVSYTVQRGDNLEVIARKTGAKTLDIINANKIADPSRIQVGQTLFIPTTTAK